ncbi:SPFH domain-containing protein [Sorangium sp. So ce1151]|uniref:SPFH domain-containing protein n=1 Tax=Sorangium sp. So ce1151 TaxID=3133332 RepID=UPI003F5D62BF
MTHIDQRRVIMNGEAGAPAGAAAVVHAGDRGTGAGGPGRYEQGWRAGKPAEDPEKLKRWGRISAKPSEYLIHMRRGQLRPTSGQGASCFKLPGDSVAVVPTTVQKLQFAADQVTLEKVGVEVTGLAVYRIVDPLIAFRMLNFSFPERAQEKLEALLVDMFAGAVRRLVANLSVEECMTRRKEGLAGELMREIAPVVAGRGSAEDTTDKGWGVLIDTIEIQDVRILSPAVFGHLQAHYRQEQERKAREASLLTERAVRQGEAEAQRAIELTKLSAEVELRTRRQETSEKARLEELASEARLKETRLAHEQQIAALSVKAEIEKTALEAEAAAARHAAKMAASAHEIDLLRQRAAIASARRLVAEAELAIAEIEASKARLTQELELERARALREIENTVSPEIIRLTVAQQMPALAAAFQQRMGEVHVTAVDGANPFGYIAAALEGVMGLARAAGLEVPPARAEKAELAGDDALDSGRR